ncbi:MAG: sulfite exporter TauE/SafE family protein [Nannocystaceae bacterium]
MSDDPSQRAQLRYWSPWLGVFVVLWLVAVGVLFPDPLQLAGRHWGLLVVGFGGALLGNATAVGGGLVFIPVMLLVYKLDPVESLKLAIVAQSFGMTSGAVGWLQSGEIAPRALRHSIVPLVVGCTLGTIVVQPTALLVKGVFGPVSMAVGVLTLILLGRGGSDPELPPRSWPWALWVGALVGGLLTGWVAIGAGEVVGACLMLVYGIRARRAIGVGVVCLAICSLYLLALQQWLPGAVPWEMGMFVGLGCVFGARLGPHVALSISPRLLKTGFAVVAILDGGLVFAQFLLH